MSLSAGSPGNDEGNETAVAAIAGVIGAVRTKAASRSSQDRIGIVNVIRSWSASQASSNHEMADTASSSASPRALAAAELIRSGSADHQCTTWLSRRIVLSAGAREHQS